MGRPADAADYDLSDLVVPDGLSIDDGFQERMVAKLHARGASQELVAGILADFYEDQGGQFQEFSVAIEQNRASGIQDLKNEWGKGYEGKLDLAKRAFMAGAGENFDQVAGLQLQGGGVLGDHPAIIRAFASLGGKMSEHGLVGGSAANSTLSPSEATSEKAKLMNDQAFMDALLNKNNPEHAAAVKRKSDLTMAEVGTE